MFTLDLIQIDVFMKCYVIELYIRGLSGTHEPAHI